MKKIIALALTAAITVSAFTVTAFAEEQPSADVREKVVYTDPDPFIVQMSGIWYDEAGNEYRSTIIPKKEEPAAQELPEIRSRVSWSDGTNTYVSDSSTHTVTIFDADGNVIVVKPA